MAIYDHKYGNLNYFRVFRAWGGKEHQHYVRIKKSRDAAYREAQAIDRSLARQQADYVREQTRLPEYHVRDDGHIRGLRRVMVTRKGRTPADVFELRINVPWEKEIKRTTLSINVHGEEKAFSLAVERICEWYGLPLDSDVADAMRDCFATYAKDGNKAGSAIQKARDEFSNLTGGLVRSLRRFTA